MSMCELSLCCAASLQSYKEGLPCTLIDPVKKTNHCNINSIAKKVNFENITTGIQLAYK